MSSPPTLISLVDAIPVVQDQTGQAVSRQTIHNWTTRGRGGVKLKAIKTIRGRRTTERWIIDFLARMPR